MSTEQGGVLDQGTERTFAGYREFVPALAGILVALLALVLARSLPSETTSTFPPSWWPVGLSTLLLLLGGLQVLAATRRLRAGASASVGSGALADEPEPATRSGAVRLVLMLAAIAGYGVLWYYIDFRVSTTILFVALSFIAGVRGVKALVLFPVLATAVLWLLFGVLLRVPI